MASCAEVIHHLRHGNPSGINDLNYPCICIGVLYIFNNNIMGEFTEVAFIPCGCCGALVFVKKIMIKLTKPTVDCAILTSKFTPGPPC